MLDFVTVPAGTFLMGARPDDRFATDTERPAHPVTFNRAFALGRFPITVGDYARFRPDHAPHEDSAWPVVNVSWEDCAAYCAWLGGDLGRPVRLPLEAEWEYACRAGSAGPFTFGTSLEPSLANFLYDETGQTVGPGARTPVGRYPLNAFGLGDVHGNVCEWTADAWQPNYLPAEASPAGRAAAPRVIRGGAWDYLPRLLRSAWRDSLPTGVRRDNVGFRVAADLP